MAERMGLRWDEMMGRVDWAWSLVAEFSMFYRIQSYWIA